MNRITEVVKNLLIINVIIFIGVSLTQGNTSLDIVRYFQLYAPYSDKFQPVQLITHMFMHGGISHLFFNMLALFFLGPFVEKKWEQRDSLSSTLSVAQELCLLI